MPAHIHMITGLTGAGKSTYAERLRLNLSGVRFSIDDWNANLFFMDRDPSSDYHWFYERVQRSCQQMRDTAEHVLEAGVPAIFDCGFTDLRERTRFYYWADELGVDVTLYFLDVDRDIRWARVGQRNAERGDTYVIEITRDMFDFMETIWEAPSTDELAARNGVVVTA